MGGHCAAGDRGTERGVCQRTDYDLLDSGEITEEEEMNNETWRPILETNGDYEVSNLGNVRNVNTGNVRATRFLPNGYAYITYHINGRRYHRYIHRLVAEAFCDRPNGCNVVNHLDNNKKNNNASNLEWTTSFGNIHHAMKQKRCYLNAIPVIGYKDGKRFEFLSANDAMKKTGCDNSSISKCCKGIYQTSKGYRWEYAEVGL